MNKSQRGSSSKLLLGFLGIFAGVFVIIIAVAAAGWWNASTFAARIEPQLKAERENNMNILAQGQQMVQEAAQVPGMMTEDTVKIVKEAIQGRYGDGGAKAAFLALQEHNPSLDSKAYTKIQQLIESYRVEFKNSQTKMIDVKRQYESAIAHPWTGFWLRIAGFPKVNLDDFKPIITDRVENVYSKGKEDAPLKLR